MKKKDTYTHRITIRLDDDLYSKIVNGAKASGISQVEYARQLLKRGKVTVKKEIIAEIPELKKLIADLGRIGSNLNQIARHYNGGGVRSKEMYDRTQLAISELFAMKYELEKLGGEFRGYSQARLNKKH